MTLPDGAPHVVVIGAGISGLSAAHSLLCSGRPMQVTVLEGSPEVGGKLRLQEVGGQPVDVGAEAVLNRRPEATELAAAVGLGDDLVYPATTGAGVWTRGAVRPLPPTLMGVPADLDSDAAIGILGVHGCETAERERQMPPVDVTEDVGVGALVAQRLGDEVRDRLVEPLLGGVYAGRSDEISVHAAVPQLVTGIREHGSLLAAASAVAGRKPRDATATAPVLAPVFAGLAGGVGRLATGTATEVERRGGLIRRNAMVRGLSQTTSGWRLVVGPTADPEVVAADAVVVAVPGVPAARLLAQPVPAAAAELGQIEYASMALVTLALRASAVDVDLAGTGFLVPPVEGRQIKAATYTSRKWGWLADDVVMVRCSIGRHRDLWQLQRADGELVDAAVADLRDAVGLTGPVLDTHVQRWGGALPQYAVGHLDRVRRARAAVGQHPGLALCGAALDGVGVPACVATGQEAATQVVEHLASRETMGT